MTRYILILLAVIPMVLNGQLICIDTSIVSNANRYLVKGANARRDVIRLNKLVKADSVIINYQDSVIERLEFNTDSLDVEIQKRNHTILLQRDVIKGVGMWAILVTIMAIFL
jgi:hypothetical protein